MKDLIRTTVGMMVNGTPMIAKITMRLDRDWRGSKPRVYVEGSAVKPAWDHPEYGSTRGDGSADDKAWRRYNREEMRLGKMVLKAMGVEAKFSRYAGCSCPCSPGYIAERGGVRGYTTWIVIEPLKF